MSSSESSDYSDHEAIVVNPQHVHIFTDTLKLYSHMANPLTLRFIGKLDDLWYERRRLEFSRINAEHAKERYFEKVQYVIDKFEKGEIKNLLDKVPFDDETSYLEYIKHQLDIIEEMDKKIVEADIEIEKILNKISSLENSINSLMIKKNIHPFIKA